MKGLAAGLAALMAIGVLFFVYLSPSAPPAETTEAETARIQAEVTQAITDRLSAYEGFITTSDFEGWWSYWTPDIRILEPGMDMTGNEFHDFGKEFFEAGGSGVSADWESYEVFVHGDVAYQVGRVDETFQLPGADPTVNHNHFFARWEKQPDGMWKMSRFLAGPIDAPSGG